MKFTVSIVVAVIVCAFSLCFEVYADRYSGVGTKGMVVAVSPEGTDVGLAILKKGGNAVDAAIATGFAMAVTYPAAGNIGGGGFMLIHPPRQQPVVIDYREKAPLEAHRTVFTKEDTVHSHRAVGVPGTVRGFVLAHNNYGSLPWRVLLEPAIRLAKEGFVLDKPMVKSLNEGLSKPYIDDEFRRVFGKPDGKAWQVGDRLIQPDLARTLSRIAVDKDEDFYRGKTATLLIDEMKRGKGLIAKKDLHQYRAKVRKPIHGTYRGYDIYGPPPPSSGGIALIEMLNVLEPFELRKHDRWSPRTLHLMIEAMRRAYLDRAKHLGDADFVEIPAHLTSKDYGRRLGSEIDEKKATPSESLAPELELTSEGDSTTHFSVIDNNGLAVSNTYTLEQSYGSTIVVKNAGFLLNNEMGDFNWFPGESTKGGRIGTEPNTVAPGKRMLSSQTPTIVAKNGRVVLVTGSPGGRTIINTSLQVVLNVLEFEMSLREAVDAPRIHHQWFPDVAKFEGVKQHRDTVETLRKMGHTVEPHKQGDAHSIWVDPKTGRYHGEADRRINGKAAGY